VSATLSPVLPPLSEWEGFYVIIGSSAAALTGLMFVVVALLSERRQRDTAAFAVFATPTIVHFGAVLLIAAFMTTPGHSVRSLRLCLLACGIAGLGYMTWVILQGRKQKSYKPELEDWIFHFWLPPVAYVLVLISALILGTSHGSLYLIGASALLLLFIGIHNAWDSAVWTITKPKR
jgi:hypothetical protein